MICPKCSQVMPDGSKFCQSCGAKLIDDATTIVESVSEQTEESVTDVDAAEEEQAEENRMAVEETAGAEQAIMGAKAMSESAPAMTQTATSGMKAAAGATAGAAVKKGVSLPLVFGLVGGGVFLVAAAITLVIVFAINGKSSSIQLSDYTKVTFEGKDGNGKAKAKLDEVALAYKLAEDMGIDTSLVKDIDPKDADLGAIIKEGVDNFDELMDIYSAMSGIDLELDKKSDLKNGDTVQVTYKLNEKRVKKVKTEILSDPMTVTVTGLAEVEEVDPFEKMNVHVDGVSPKAYIYCDSDSDEEWMEYVSFTAEPADGLKKGDTVKIKVNSYDEDLFEEKYGVKFSQTEIDYKLENVDAYVTENAALEQAAVEKMKSATEEYVKQYFEDSNREKQIKGADIKYVGYYLLTTKNTDTWDNYNKVYLVYSASVSSKEKPKGFKTKTVYFPVEYDDIKRLADGTYDIETSYRRILGSTDLKFGFWQMVDGYTSTDTMYDELVTDDEADFQGAGYDGLAG